MVQTNNIALIVPNSKQQMVAICANNLEHIFSGDVDLALDEERSQVVVVENGGRSVVVVGEVYHRLGFVYSFEVGVEVLTGSDGECCCELPDANGIVGVEWVDQDFVSGQT